MKTDEELAKIASEAWTAKAESLGYTHMWNTDKMWLAAVTAVKEAVLEDASAQPKAPTNSRAGILR